MCWLLSRLRGSSVKVSLEWWSHLPNSTIRQTRPWTEALWRFGGSAVLYELRTQSMALWGRLSHRSHQPPRLWWVDPVKIISMTSERWPPLILLQPIPFFTPTDGLPTQPLYFWLVLLPSPERTSNSLCCFFFTFGSPEVVVECTQHGQ